MTFQSSKEGFAGTRSITLQDILERTAAAPSLTAMQKRDIASAINSVARWHHRPPSEISASHEQLRRFFEDLSFGNIGVTRARVRNVQSLLKLGLAAGGVTTSIRSVPVPINSEWSALRERVEDRHARDSLGRFARFCSARGIAPQVVDDGVVETYRRALADEDLVARPDVAAQSIIRVWNRMGRDSAAWPQIRLTPFLRRETYSLRWDDVPLDLAADVESYLKILSGADPMHPLAPARPLKPLSIRKRRYEFIQLISGMKHRGVVIEHLHCVADLCNVDFVKRGLNFFIDRHRQRHGQDSDPGTSTMIAGIADAIRAVAKHYVQAPEPVVRELTRFASRLNRRPKGMSEKNRTRLAQLNSPLLVRKLLSHPLIEMQKLARKKKITRKDAVRYSVLLGIETLIIAPMRVENLSELDLEKNFSWPPRGKGEIRILVPRSNVKNVVPLEYKIPVGSTPALRTYLERFRPLLGCTGSTALFPGRGRGSKRSDGLSKQIKGLIHNELGIVWHAHLFRHLAVRLYLQKYLGDFEGAKRLLAHVSAETTYKIYEGEETRPVLDRYDELLQSVRGSVCLELNGKKPRRAFCRKPGE